MARLVQGIAVTAQTPPAKTTDPLTDLTRLLGRLQQTVLRADAERQRRLRTSEYERARVEANIQYARSLLTKLEQEALGIKILSRRQEWQADLNRKRDLLDQLTERVKDLEEMGATEDDESSEGEDILSDIVATPSESMDSRSTGVPLDEPDESSTFDTEKEAGGTMPDIPEAAARPQPPPYRETQEPAATPIPEKREATASSHTLRSRYQSEPSNRSHKDDEKETAQATGSAALYGDGDNTSLSPTTLTEAVLDSQRAEQDSLSESILKMASDLKASSQAFAGLLEEDKDVVNAAGQGLDKNETGLEAAARRMGTLRKMTEGKGWWGRMMLYAWIYGLMVLLVLVVFVLPKLRF